MKEELLHKDLRYVIGVSGGCDSMYLLDILRQKGYHLYVAHVNYHWRYDSDEDYFLVKNYCHHYQIPFYYKECQKNDYQKGNFQDQAREIRYSFYQSIYLEHHCDGVLLAHHLDDHLETIYMQLQKHETVYYLGMKEINRVMNMTIIRPLLDMKKQDILQACCKRQIPYRDDYTNFETDFERDCVRNIVLKKYTKKQKEELLIRAQEHNKRMKKLEFKVAPYYQHYKKQQKINWRNIPDELLDIFFYLLLNDLFDSRQISSLLIQEMIHQMKSPKPNIQMNLPVNYLFIKEYDNIYITNRQNDAYCYCFVKWEPFVCDYFSLAKEGHINEGVYLNEEDYPITIRTIQKGDRILTSSGTKKLSRLFINAKIPASQRKTWPVLLNKDQTIVLVPHIAKNIDYLTTKPNLFVIK